MAVKETKNSERKYIIPLKREFNKVPNYQRTSKATKAIRNFIKKHMKVDEVKISKELNLKIWSRGRKNPPVKVEVKTIQEDGFAHVTLPELAFAKKKIKKAPKAEGLKGKLQETVAGLKGEKEVEEKKEPTPVKEEKKPAVKETPVKKETAKPVEEPKTK